MTRRPLLILKETRAAQARAADPALSAWVSANAGSGKTHVLANRVIRLLLDGAEPSRILCLTYTRAAAGEMKSRIFRTLGAWATLDDTLLAERIAELEERRPDTSRLVAARRLFARALDTPGGLKIQTIHAFCEAILRRFPLEANIAGHFELIDQAAADALLAEARRGLLSGLDDPARPVLAAAFARVLDAAGEAGLESLLAAIIAERDALAGFIDKTSGNAWAAFYERFGLAPGVTEGALVRGLWPDPRLPRDRISEWHALSVGLNKKTAAERTAIMLEAFAEVDERRQFGFLKRAFLKADGDPRKIADFLPKDVIDRFGDLEPALVGKVADVHAAADRVATLAMVEDTIAALTLAHALIERYSRLKAGRGLLDFNDLIHRTVMLLSRKEAGQWVQYKLDQGVDHLLVDEAQDTSPAQWRVVAGVVSEFFAGEGARRDVVRTLFAVGDEKQSIYSFQGADPAAFSVQREHYRSVAEGAGKAFEDVNLNFSFRSTEDVLSFVDAVFSDPDTRRGLTRDPGIEHKSVRVGAPGSVELWPSIAATEVEEPGDWRDAIDLARAPEVKLAQAIANVIARWIAAGEMVEGKAGVARPMRPGDVIVLVRKRDRFMHALSRALKEMKPEPIAAAGADRLRLTDHIAVKDMVALGRICLQPHDDLSLAALLKSPVFAFDERMLFDLAAERGGDSLLAALARKGAAAPECTAVFAAIQRWRGEVDVKPPFEFFAGVLGSHGATGGDSVRARMTARLGPGAGEILDEFLAYVLAAERAGVAGLDALLAALDAAPPEIRRDAAEGRDEVRIMTAHAAKGLEAPVVFVVDSGGAPSHASHLPVLMKLPVLVKGEPVEGFVWRSGQAAQNSLRRAREAELKQAAEEEYRRLLYVGLTRAEDRLVLCGYHGGRSPDGRWHHVAERAFDALAAGGVETVRLPELDADIRRYALSKAPPGAPAAKAVRQAEEEALPDWLTRPAAIEPPQPQPLSPSGAALIAEAAPAPPRASPVFAAEPGAAFAISRGETVHRLLQVLPGLPANERRDAAARYLERAASGWPAGEAERASDAVLAVLERADFAPVFAPGSRAEVAIQGVVRLGGRERTVAGKIDRIVIGGDILIVDYKTGRPPSGAQGVAEAHVAQLALYRAILGALHPGRPVRAALLHVDAPRLDEIGAKAMDDAMARLDAALRTA